MTLTLMMVIIIIIIVMMIFSFNNFKCRYWIILKPFHFLITVIHMDEKKIHSHSSSSYIKTFKSTWLESIFINIDIDQYYYLSQKTWIDTINLYDFKQTVTKSEWVSETLSDEIEKINKQTKNNKKRKERLA